MLLYEQKMLNIIIVIPTNRYWQHTKNGRLSSHFCFVLKSSWAWNTCTMLKGTTAAEEKIMWVEFISHLHWCKSAVSQLNLMDLHYCNLRSKFDPNVTNWVHLIAYRIHNTYAHILGWQLAQN